MKDTVKFFSIVTGIFRSIVTIIFLLGIGFTILVDTKLLISFLDLLGFQGISAGVVKPLLILLFALLFVVNFIISKNIYKAGDTGQYHLSNFVFGLLFLALTGFFFITFRNRTTNLIFVLIALNAILVINSLLGLIAKTRGLYATSKIENPQKQKTSNYIEFEDEPKENAAREIKAVDLNKALEDTSDINQIKSAEEKSSQKSNNVDTKLDGQAEKEPTPYKELATDEKLVFESKDNKENKDVSQTNKISYDNKENKAEIYGDEEADKIKREKDSKLFNKDQFTKIKIDDINKDK